MLMESFFHKNNVKIVCFQLVFCLLDAECEQARSLTRGAMMREISLSFDQQCPGNCQMLESVVITSTQMN